jgi:GT2 family glycosyltransferase
VKFISSGRVAVVVPVHDRLAHTRHLLSELRRATHDEALVIVVDDGSTDGTNDYLREDAPDVLVLHGSGQLWWSGAVNLGCRHAIDKGSEVLVLLNNDNTEVSANCIQDLVERVDAYDGCVSSVALMAHSRQLIHAGGLIRWPFRGIELRENGHPYVPQDRVAECDWLPGTSMAFPADLFTELDGFDADAFPQYCGDTDFTLRARAAKRPCIVSYKSWIANDETSTGVHFYSRLRLSAFFAGLVSRKSPYQIRTTLRFAARYCPKHLLPAYLALFYARYVYASLKSWAPRRLHPDSR